MINIGDIDEIGLLSFIGPLFVPLSRSVTNTFLQLFLRKLISYFMIIIELIFNDINILICS